MAVAGIDSRESRGFYWKTFVPLVHMTESVRNQSLYISSGEVYFYSSAHARDLPHVFVVLSVSPSYSVGSFDSQHLSQSLPKLSPHQSSSLNNTTVLLLSSIRHYTLCIRAFNVHQRRIRFAIHLYTHLSRRNLFPCAYYPPGDAQAKLLQRFRRRRLKKYLFRCLSR